MKFIDLFAGIGGFHTGLEKSGHECVAFSEIDKAATKSYKAIYDPDGKLAYFPDVTKFTNEQAEEFKAVDIITAGFPCFERGTLITTSEGYKNIEDIVTGDKVLTHTNTFKEVVLPMKKHKKGIYELKIFGSPLTKVTEEHPYYVVEKERYWNNFKSKYETSYSEPKWVNVKDLDIEKHLVGFATNTESVNTYNITKEEAYMLGKYLEKDLSKVKSLDSLIARCSNDLKDEEISGLLLSLPKDILKELVKGYIEYNGYLLDGYYRFKTLNKYLAYSLGQAIQKVYKTNYTLTFKRNLYTLKFKKYDLMYNKGIVIEDEDTQWKPISWNPIEEINYLPEWEDDVYNFEVSEDNSYVANNVIVHNCQSFSVGGKKLGMKDDRGLLFLEVVRLSEVIKPKYVIMENVKGLLSNRSTLDDEAGIIELLNALDSFDESGSIKLTPKPKYSTLINNLSFYADNLKGTNERIDKFIEQDFVVQKLIKGVTNFEAGTFNIIVNKFSEIGYNLEWRVFNSSDFGVSQSRERVYIIAHRREEETVPVLLSIGTHERIVDFREIKEDSKGENHNIDVIPIINPAFRNKKINGRVFKEPNEDMYTITKIGNHGYLLVSKDEFPDGQKGEFSDKLHQMFELSEYNDCKDLYYTSRKITPLEAWELMGYEEEQFNKASTVNPDYSLYQQAGNSITPQIVYNIGRLLK